MSYRICGVSFGDMHATTRTIAGRVHPYQVELVELCDQVLKLATLSRADFVCTPGDLFHSKLGTTHEDVVFAMKLLRPIVDKFGPVLVVPGNHDMIGNDPEHAHARQPFGVLLHAGMIRDVSSHAHVVEKLGHRVAIVGAPYSNGIKIAEALAGVLKHQLFDGCDDLVVLLHHAIKLDRPLVELIMGTYKLEQASRCFDRLLIVNGHEHDQRESRLIREGKVLAHVASLGCLGRTSRAERDLVPHLTTCVLKKDLFKLTQSPLDCLVGDELFAPLSTRDEDALHDDVQVHEFVASLRRAGGATTVDPVGLVREQGGKLNVSADVIEAAVQLVKLEQ